VDVNVVEWLLPCYSKVSASCLTECLHMMGGWERGGGLDGLMQVRSSSLTAAMPCHSVRCVGASVSTSRRVQGEEGFVEARVVE
jgi:hypothetical protein